MKYFIFFFSFLLSLTLHAQDSTFTQQEIIYGRKDGMALTMIKLQPGSNANGKAILRINSGNWVSSFNRVPAMIESSSLFIKSGYTVFVVMHGAQPRYTIPDQVEDIKRAVRYVRFHAKRLNIDPAHIGITGSSSGGNLSLLIATADDLPPAKSADTIDKVSARVQAVAVFFPPTDFLNWRLPGTTIAKNEGYLKLARVSGAFDFKTWDNGLFLFTPVTDSVKRTALFREVSPIYAVSSDDPPALIVHGDKDIVVPLQQSQSIIAKLEAAHVPNKLIIKPGGGHGWTNQDEEMKEFVKWFDKYLQ